MKNQALFSSKDKCKKLKCHLLQFLFGSLKVKLLNGGILIVGLGVKTCLCVAQVVTLQLTLTSPLLYNSLTAKKQTTKLSSANFQKMLSRSHIILRILRLEGKQCSSR